MLIRDLFLLRPEPYVHACENPRAAFWVSGFLVVTGVLYGSLVALFQRALGGELQGIPIDQIPDAILFGGNIASGMFIVLITHLGATLVAWLMAKGVGGPGGLVGLYRTTAYLLPLFMPALPKVALGTVMLGRDLPAVPYDMTYTIMAGAAVVMVLTGHYQAIRVTQDVSPARAAASAGLCALFIGSLLLLF
jgi:hypothetical protein